MKQETHELEKDFEQWEKENKTKIELDNLFVEVDTELKEIRQDIEKHIKKRKEYYVT